MLKLTSKFLLAFLAAFWLALPALAQNYWVDITNRTGYTITYVYVSPAASQGWGDDQLGANSVLRQGETIRIHLRGYSNPMFDIRLVDEDRDTYTYWNVDVSRRDIVAVLEHIDKK